MESRRINNKISSEVVSNNQIDKNEKQVSNIKEKNSDVNVVKPACDINESSEIDDKYKISRHIKVYKDSNNFLNVSDIKFFKDDFVDIKKEVVKKEKAVIQQNDKFMLLIPLALAIVLLLVLLILSISTVIRRGTLNVPIIITFKYLLFIDVIVSIVLSFYILLFRKENIIVYKAVKIKIILIKKNARLYII